MEINNMMMSNVQSVRQAIGMVNLRNAMNQNAISMDTLLQGMSDASAKILENSVTPHKGNYIDIKI